MKRWCHSHFQDHHRQHLIVVLRAAKSLQLRPVELWELVVVVEAVLCQVEEVVHGCS